MMGADVPATARLDVMLTALGLARSRTHAARLIGDGRVRVDGDEAVKPSQRIRSTSTITVAGADHYVSRAAHKLVAGLDAFAIEVAGRVALDVGASTGGFTQVLCERGVERVVALDVGHGQLAPEVAADPRVTVIEGFNARELSAEALDHEIGGAVAPDLVVGDLSFISLRLVIPALVRTAVEHSDFVLLVKPQFEVGRTGIREGIVRDAGLRADALAGVLWSAWDAGLGTRGVVSSPILGGSGNREYVVHLSSSGGSNPTEWLERVSSLSR